MPSILGYLSGFSPLRGLLNRLVIKKNPFGLKDKAYSSIVITRFLVMASLSLNRSLHDLEDLFPAGPTARTVLNRLYEIDPDYILEAFNNHNTMLYGKLTKTLTRGNRVTFVNLDHHFEPYWGEDTLWIRKGRKRHSTVKFLPLETYSIQIEDFKITLMARPYKWVTRKGDPKKRLEWAEGYVEALKWINREFIANKVCLVADGGFFVAIILAKLDEAGFYFVVRGPRSSPRIREIMQKIDFNSILPNENDVLEVDGYSISSGHNRPFVELPARLIFVRRGGEVIPLVTNLPPSYTAKYIIEVYKARFWIENSYRDSRQMRIRTRSRKLSVRYVCFLIGLILLNFFILALRILNLAHLGFRAAALILVILYASNDEKTA